ncbi:MAG: hypothetical protein PWR12_1258 [Eubacteriaceae bacterium]|nr:hypothetical protein [Eubacteriaceae bacterium]MDK2905182.1 hypothetical protein [Eubacteriaceae bacterium]MDK2961580.1 hypothetical protein [Eubacteriaceae bacterium]
MDIKGSDKQLIVFRKKKFNELLSELEQCVNGLNLQIKPFIINAKGDYSERKTHQFVNRLVKGLDENYKDQVKFYKSLFYCMIRALTTPYTLYEDSNSFSIAADDMDTTFFDLIDGIDMEYVEDDDGINHPQINWLPAIIMGALYEILSGTELNDAVTKLYDYRNEIIIHDPSPEELQEYYNSLDEEEIAKLEEETKFYDDLIEENIKLNEIETLRIKKRFPSAAEYCKQFEMLLSQVEKGFQVKNSGNHIQIMVDRFLSDQGLPIFYDTDAYLELCTYLKKTIKKVNQAQIRSGVSDAKCKK